jgi:quercetin dioxygenase-like cupin family protein
LNIDLNDFFKSIDAQTPDKVIFKKKEAYHAFEKENAIGFHYQRLFSTSLHEYHIDFVLLRLEKGAQREPVSTDAFEFKYLLKGKVEYTIADKLYVMEEGDSLFFDATDLHNPKSVGEEDALLLVAYFFNKIK